MIVQKRYLLIVLVPLFFALIFLATRSTRLRNAYYAITYERTLDAYSQTDTTVTDVVASIDPSGRHATLLSAFFGLDDALPGLASLVACEGAGGQDGMPVVFSHELDVKSVEPGDFEVTSASGTVGEVTCLTLAPADDPGELRTVLLIGQYGSADDQPKTVQIVGNVLALDHTVNFKGASVAVTPLEDGPTLVTAELVPETLWALDQPGTSIPFGGGSGCPTGTSQIVRVTWSGGITKPGGRDADDVERTLYSVTLKGGEQASYKSSPYALGDLQDGDNNHMLCLDTADAVISVAFPAGHLTDPRDDLNPASSVAVNRQF